jgi:hypothetical protein
LHYGVFTFGPSVTGKGKHAARPNHRTLVFSCLVYLCGLSGARGLSLQLRVG